MMYTVAEAAKIAKISAVKADEIINQKGIPTEYFGGRRFISEENISLLKPAKPVKVKKDKPKIHRGRYYKVSVFDSNLFGFVVKKCCLQKKDALALVEHYRALGIEAKASIH